MTLTAKEIGVFEELEQDEFDLVSSYASSLVRNRTPHTDAYNKFQEIRATMLKKNPMTTEEIDQAIHEGDPS